MIGTVKAVLAIVGPTATGKSDLGLRLAEELDGEIINADALQVYRGLDIGTAKPSPEEQARVPHHLVDILDPSERYSAGEFARRARRAIDGVRERGRRPILVGGSGLYLRALLDGISPIPPASPELRERLRLRLVEEGLEALREELRQKDPVTEARLGERDERRVLRALEVVLETGRPQSAWISQNPFGDRGLPAVRIGLTLPRSVLYDRIEKRVRAMAQGGWADEVRCLMAAGCSPEVPAFQAIGYRQMVRHVLGEWSLEEALSATTQATRRFAKRQLTWFRKDTEIHWVQAQGAASRVPDVLSIPGV